MDEKLKVQAISAPASTFQKAKELGDGNISRGFREAVERLHKEWEREQAAKWMERAKAALKDGEA